ncbi:TRAP transporter small permease [Alteribacillus sp. JSM 102045]|uniref:TRAP transporter small permease n=1 Tax=Alteribacillus sp. JSM 102045 TaxID=1562101 RepID=UPI0035C10FE9
MENIVKKVDKGLTFLEENVLFLLLLFMLCTVFFGLTNRYVFQEGIRWGEELPRYLLIWATFIGASYGMKKGIHITVDVITVYASEKINRYMRAISYIISIAFCLTLLWIGVPYIVDIMRSNQVSPAMQLPMYWFYLSAVVGMFLMLIRLLILFVSDFVFHEEIESHDAMKLDNSVGR